VSDPALTQAGDEPEPAGGTRVEVLDVHKVFEHGGRNLEVLRGITFTLEPGEMAAIVGASGVGKSTLLHILGTGPPTLRPAQVGGLT
jgi:ABC-type nitrate/sulfonate/bicarbonate transport system ATPase subunit